MVVIKDVFGILTPLPSNTREMILIVPEIITLECHQGNDSGLLGLVGHLVRIE